MGLLKSLGRESFIFFSPLTRCRKILDAELYLKELEENESMRNSVKSAIENKMPSLAECGGFMYLHAETFYSEKKPYKMAGVIHAGCMKKERLVRFGYLTLKTQRQTAF